MHRLHRALRILIRRGEIERYQGWHYLRFGAVSAIRLTDGERIVCDVPRAQGYPVAVSLREMGAMVN